MTSCEIIADDPTIRPSTVAATARVAGFGAWVFPAERGRHRLGETDVVSGPGGSLATAPIAVQVTAFERMVLSNAVTAVIVQRLQTLGAPNCYLAAGALFQTVWNCLTGRDPQAGINDYDVNYHDDTDLSWDAEDQVIRRAASLFADLPVTVEVRNEARVHLWYEQKFGVACPPYPSTEAAIATFPNTSSCYGIRQTADGLEVFAPYGFTDLFALRTRPNPVLAPRAVYEAKTARWRREWPELTVLPWPQENPVAPAASPVS